MTKPAPVVARADASMALLEYPSGAAQLSGTASAGDLWRILWHRRLMVLSISCALFVTVLVYCLAVTPLYTATSEILIDPRDRLVFSNDVNPTGIAADGGITQIESQARVIESSSVLLRAIDTMKLTQDPEFNRSGGLGKLIEGLGPWAEQWGGASAARFIEQLGKLVKTKATPSDEASADTAIEANTLRGLRRRLAVKRAEKVFVIDVIVTARTAIKASRVANAIADAYLADQAEAKAHAAEAASASLTARLSEQHGRVQGLENEIQSYKMENGILWASGQLLNEEQLSSLHRRLLAAHERTVGLQAKLDQLHEAGASVASIPEVMQSQVIAALREQEGTLSERLAEFVARFGQKYPLVPPLEVQLSEVKSLISAELNRISAAIQADYDRARIEERVLSLGVEHAKSATLAVNQAAVHLRELERDLDAARTVYSTFLVRAQETREQASIDPTNARVITRSLPPQEKSWPPTLMLLAGSIGGGLSVGCGLALILGFLSPSVLSSGQIERAVNAPVIAILPAAALPGRRRSRSIAPGGEGSPRALAIVELALQRLSSADVDAIVREPAGVRTLLFTSGARDAETRRQVCDLFATAAGTIGNRVLIIDADLGDDKASTTPGLLDVLNGEFALNMLIDTAPSTSVALLGKGRKHPDSSKGRNISDVSRLMFDAKQYFDTVIIDGGVMADNFRVAPLLVAAEQVVLVAQLTKTPQDDTMAAADAARIMGGAISSIFLVDPKGTG